VRISWRTDIYLNGGEGEEESGLVLVPTAENGSCPKFNCYKRNSLSN